MLVVGNLHAKRTRCEDGSICRALGELVMASCGGCGQHGCGQRLMAPLAADSGLLKCMRCMRVAYCSRACQKKAWRSGHKHECVKLHASNRGAQSMSQQQALRAALLRDDSADKNCISSSCHECTSATSRFSAQLGDAECANPATLSFTTKQQRFLKMMPELLQARDWKRIVGMKDEGLEVAGELCAVWPNVASEIYRALGHSFLELCQYVKAIWLLEQARALAEDASNQKGLRNACTSLGICLEKQGEFDKAIGLHEQARSISVSLGDREGEGVASNNLAICYREMNQFDRAFSMYEESLAIAVELGDKVGEAKTRSSLGCCLLRQGQYKEAVAFLTQSRAVLEQMGDAIGQARASLRLGEALWLQAGTVLRDCDAVHAAPNDYHNETGGDGGWDACAQILNDAETWFLSASDIALKNGFWITQLESQMHLACLNLFKGHEDKAVDLLARHLQGRLDLGDCMCAGCGQRRGNDAPMLLCGGCRSARSVHGFLSLAIVSFLRREGACEIKPLI